MDKTNYIERIESLGLNQNQWAKICGVNRSTISTHYKLAKEGKEGQIASPYWKILILLENNVQV